MRLPFEWDASKAKANLAKHGVSLEEAATAFADPLARIHDDPDHSGTEGREILIGQSAARRLLLVCFTERAGAVRIISARTTDRDERRRYEEEKLP